MKKMANNFFKKIAEKHDIDSSSDFGKYFESKSIELSDIGVDNSFKIEMLKKADLLSDEDTIKKLSFDYFSGSPSGKDSLDTTLEWKNLYYKIKSQASNKSHANSLAEKYSNDLDKDEAFRFLQWFKYYSNGEHTKYSGAKMKIKKKGNYNFGTSPNGPYAKEPSFDERDTNVYSDYINDVKNNIGRPNPDDFLRKINLANDGQDELNDDSVEFKENSMTDAEFEQKKVSIDALRKSISRGVKGILSNVMNTDHLSEESIKKIVESLNSLTFESHKLSNANTISSVIHKTANKLQRDGISYGIDDLIKLAQEVESQQTTGVEAPVSEVQSAETSEPAADAGVAQAEEPTLKDKIPLSDVVEPVKFEDIETKGPEDGEYDRLIEDDISISDASKKLDQVAGMLADRRVIRNLAEFDIMLDKLGIASMFPELAESQSKLIDAFGYALTRVTKMMGQLANAQTIMGKSTSIPGSVEASEE